MLGTILWFPDQNDRNVRWHMYNSGLLEQKERNISELCTGPGFPEKKEIMIYGLGTILRLLE